MEIKGTLHKKNNTQIVSEKFKKREFIIKVAGQYPEYLNCQLVNDKCFLLDKIRLDGEKGGIGVLEAQEFSIVAKERGKTIQIAKSMINLWDAVYDYEKREISAPLHTKGGTDWISNNAEGLSFEFIMANGHITTDDFILSPYVLEKETPTSEKILVAITAITVITQVRDQVQAIQEIVAFCCESSGNVLANSSKSEAIINAVLAISPSPLLIFFNLLIPSIYVFLFS